MLVLLLLLLLILQVLLLLLVLQLLLFFGFENLVALAKVALRGEIYLHQILEVNGTDTRVRLDPFFK